jgi:hypothetical protein
MPNRISPSRTNNAERRTIIVTLTGIKNASQLREALRVTFVLPQVASSHYLRVYSVLVKV